MDDARPRLYRGNLPAWGRLTRVREMKRIWPVAMCIGLLVACHQQSNVRREVWPPPSEPAPAVAEAPAPPPKVLDPVIVELSDRSTVMQVRKHLKVH